MSGPLARIKVVELAGIGPGPFCGMMLADAGAEIIRIDRPPQTGRPDTTQPRFDVLNRGRRSIALDLKSARGVETVLRLLDRADVLFEGFRPGVAERLGLGPEVCLERNPRLVYGRMTGWGQSGPMAKLAGHDINYIAMAGALNSIGPAGGKPVPPLSLVGDFGGGGMFLAYGIMCALVERASSGKGQVVDAAMVDGAAALMAITFAIHSLGYWEDRRGANVLDGGAHFYNTYETKDGKYISIGSVEPHFYDGLLGSLGLRGQDLPPQMERAHWPMMTEKFQTIFKSKTREEWCAILFDADVCFAPVLDLTEVPQSDHARARLSFAAVDGIVQPTPAPRFSRTATQLGLPPAFPGEHSDTALLDWGFSREEIGSLKRDGALV